ncbi:CENPE [Mytilus edulis]|uniref:CENPE n=1 Tax=Mytilus edulis TaxID=6550 RepID=A0A8S3RA35_MYTED|nr:CENPE [Mytilus edulis]
MDLFSIIDAVKKIRRDIPKCVDSLSEKITNAHKFVTAFPSKMNEFLSLQRQIDVEENVWRTKIIEIAKGLCRQIEQQMTKLDSDCIIQQQYERNAQKTIVILNAVEKVKYSNTVNIGEDLDDGTLELFKKMKIDDQDEDHREYEKNTEEKRTLEADVQRLECQLHETTRNLHGEKSDVLKRLCFLKDYAIQSKDQLHTTTDQKPKFTDDQSIFEVLDIIQTNMTYMHKNLRVLKDEILSSKEIIKTQENLQEVNILELQQHVQQLEADKSTLSEKYERICTEMENSKDGMVHKEEIRSKEEIIKTNHETIKELHQQTQQLKTANNGILEKYNQVCKERDELKNGNQSIQLAFESMERIKGKETEMHAKDQQFRQQLNEKDRDISDLNQMLNQHKEMVSDQEKKIQTIKKERDDLQLRSQSIQKVFDDYEQRIETYQRIQAEKEIEFQNKQQGFQHHLKQKDDRMSEISRIVNQQKA